MSSLARHYDSSVTLPSRMGAFTRGIAVGSPHNSNRLHSSVWEKSPPFRRGSPDSSKQRRQGFCSTTGTFLPPAERSNRGSTAVGSRTRFLQPLLPRSKEGRRLEAYPGSTAFESFPLQREVQNADDENHHVSGPGGRLVCHHRPEGCVFSHPGRSQTQEIPSVRLWREGLPIQGSALRPGFGPEDIYQMHGCCTGPFEAPGHPCTELSGRLAHSGSLQGASESSQGYRSRPHPFSWPQDEHQEECAPPISTNCISRSSFGFRSDAGPFGSCPDTSFYSMFGPLQARPSCLCRSSPNDYSPIDSLCQCIDEINSWMCQNFLQLNKEKTEVIAFGNKDEVLKVNAYLDSRGQTTKNQVRNLGVILETDLSFSSHVKAVTKSAYYHLKNIARIRCFVSSHDLEKLVHAFITSRVDYCNGLLTGLPKKTIRQLQLIQNAAARILTRTRKSEHITPVLRSLHWLPVTFRIDFKVLLLVYKSLNGLGPKYMSDMLTEYKPNRPLRSVGSSQLEIPRVHTKQGESAFSYYAARSWNQLPEEIRYAKTLATFKSSLKTHLFSCAFVE